MATRKVIPPTGTLLNPGNRSPILKPIDPIAPPDPKRKRRRRPGQIDIGFGSHNSKTPYSGMA